MLKKGEKPENQAVLVLCQFEKKPKATNETKFKITSKKKFHLSKEASTDGDIRDRSPLSSQMVSSLSLILENLLTEFVQKQSARSSSLTPGAYAEKTLGIRLSNIIVFHFQSFRKVAK